MVIDPVCAFHGLRRSEHLCLYCCLCFEILTLEECSVLPDGSKVDICKPCAEEEDRFCRSCIRSRNARLPAPFSWVTNTRTGKRHITNEYGTIYCDRDAIEDNWGWHTEVSS